jgi:hypothetical protein
MVYDYVFIISTIIIIRIIVGVKRVDTFFSVFPPVTARGLIGFFRNSNNVVRKEKSEFRKKKKEIIASS